MEGLEDDQRFDTVPVVSLNAGIIVLLPGALFFGGFVGKDMALAVAVVFAAVLMIINLVLSGFYLWLGETLPSYPYFLAAGLIFSSLIGVMVWRFDMFSLLFP